MVAITAAASAAVPLAAVGGGAAVAAKGLVAVALGAGGGILGVAPAPPPQRLARAMPPAPAPALQRRPASAASPVAAPAAAPAALAATPLLAAEPLAAAAAPPPGVVAPAPAPKVARREPSSPAAREGKRRAEGPGDVLGVDGLRSLGAQFAPGSGTGCMPEWLRSFLHSNRANPLLLGCALQLLACSASACGLVLQRASSRTRGNRSLHLAGRAGVALCVLAALPDTLSYLLAPQSLLAQLGCLEPMVVAALAWFLLPDDAELITGQEVATTLLCVAGTIGCASCAPEGSVVLQGPEVEEGALEMRVFLYLLLLIPAFGSLAYEEHEERRRNTRPCCQGLLLPALAGASLAIQRLTMAALGVALQAHGGVPSLSLLGDPAVPALAVVLGLAAISCLFHVWRGAREQPPHVFVPVYCAISAALQLAQSVLVLREYRSEPLQKVIYSIGFCSLSLMGVARLHSEHATHLYDMQPKIRSASTGLSIRVL